MVAPASSIAEQLAGLYISERDEDRIRVFLQHASSRGDDELAELICCDAELRRTQGLPVSLHRYLDLVPDLRSREIPLDAAIDGVLRSDESGPSISPVAVEALTAEFPDLAQAIRDAAALNNALRSTRAVRGAVLGWMPPSFPFEFGPVSDDGTRRYQLRSLVGAGSFGNVFRAMDRTMSEQGHESIVAVKVRHEPARAGVRPSLMREAAAARRVHHPNCVQVFDVGIADDDRPFVVYQFVEGQTLDAWMTSHREDLSHQKSVEMMIGIIHGVHAAHATGLIHCDLKPDNVLIDENGVARITDFGIARRVEETLYDGGRRELTMSGCAVGNAAFVAPEQMRREESAITTASDVYSLGAMLFWILTGHSHRQFLNDDQELSFADRSDRRAAGLPDDDIAAICAKALLPVPERRQNSAAALAEDLSTWLELRPLRWRKAGLWHRTNLMLRRMPAMAALVSLAIVLSIIAVGMTGR